MSRIWKRKRRNSGRTTAAAAALATGAALVLLLGAVAAIAGVTPRSVVRVFTTSDAASHTIVRSHSAARATSPRRATGAKHATIVRRAARPHRSPNTLTLFGGSVSTGAGFEGDDGNLTNDGATDWNDFAPLSYSGTAPYQTATETSGPWSVYAVTDAAGSLDGGNDTTYGPGVKQVDECPAIISSGSNASSPNKDDLARMYIAGKVDPSTDHVYLALAWVRVPQNTTSSSVHVAFEFNQSTTACGTSSSSLVHRTPGDILIVYNFQSGTPSLAYATWTGSAWTTETTLPANIANAAVFTTAKSSTPDALKPSGASDPATNEFGEAVIDLTQAQINFSGTSGRTCERFGRVFGESRSSGDSTQASMEDLVGPANVDLSTCASPTIATSLSTSSASVGASVHDSATLTGATSDAGGSVTYSVYSDNQCTQGKQDAGTVTVTNGAVPDSNALTFNAAGTYYWQASYSGDGNNNSAVSPCQSEVLTISKYSPTIATTLSATSGKIGDTVHDSSTLSGATADAGGTVTYTVYTDNGCSLGAQDAGTVTVTNGTVPDSSPLTLNAAGTYYWQAVYHGDSKNDGAVSPCQSEILTINPNSPTIATTLSATSGKIGDTVHDSSTLSGATADAGGTVTYTVYTDDKCSAGARDAGTVNVTNGTVPDSNALTFNAAGTYYWQASYSGDGNNKAAVSPCQSEILAIAKNSPSIATTLSKSSAAIGESVHDSSTLSGATADAGGTVTYTVYTNNTCSAGARSAGTVNVTSSSVPNSSDLTFGAAGTYYWQAAYSGDGNNDPATSPCQSEVLTINPNSPTIATTLSATSAKVGDTVHDSATLSGATADAGGTVTYTVYTDNQCSAGARSAGTVDVTNGKVPDSNALTFNAAGTYYWQAAYSGDGNNSPATSPCQSEVLTINPNSPTIATTLSASSANIGDKVHDSSTLSGATADAGGTVTYTVYTDNQCSAGARSAGTVNVTNGTVPDSNDLTFSAAGTYYWQAAYSGDGNNSPATSPCQSEVLTINPNSPTIATLLSAGSANIGDKVHDTATLTGATSDAGGTVTYTVYTDNQCTLGALSAGTVDVTNGKVPDSNDLTFSAAGTYYWQATYSGDGNNVGASSPCQSEVLTINPNSPSIATVLSPSSANIGDKVHDTATLTGATSDAGGTVQYTAYTDNQCTAGARDAGKVTVTNGAVPNSNDLTFGAAGTYYWQAAYSGDGNNEPATSPCQSEILTIAKNSPTIATTLSKSSAAIGDSVNDTATLSGATADAGGTVTYTVYTDNQCSAGARAAGIVTVTNGSVPDSSALQFDSAGTYYWQAVYSGDGNNKAATSPCQSEVLTVATNSPTIATKLSADTGAIGDTVHDSSTLTGATAGAGGTATYRVYTDQTCSTPAVAGTDIDAQPAAVTVSGGSVPDSPGVTFLRAGDFYWQVTYSGDSNNTAATSPCNAEDNEHLAIAKNSPTIATTLSSSEILAGSSVNDSAQLSGATETAGGTVQYTVYSDSECTQQFADAGQVDVDSGSVPNSNGVAFPNAGTYYWQAVYSGDANNLGATSSCTEEQLAVDSPSISITKNPKSQSIDSGGTANFTITVTNTGTVTLTNVAVTDLLAPDCGKTIGTLTPGQSTSYDCALSAVTASFTNTATATGHPPVGPDVTASDNAGVTVNAVPPPPPPPPPAPKIDLAITKVGTPNPTTLGKSITWTLTVTNNGPDGATGVTVADPIPAGTTFVSATSTQGTCTGGAALSCQIGSMNAGSTVTITLVTGTSVTGTIPNTATVVGNEAETNTANNTASASVVVKGTFKPPVVYCTALTVSPKQLFVGRTNMLRMRVTQHGKAVKGVKVRIKGSTLRIVTKPSNKRGFVIRRVRPMKAGIVTFAPVASKRCNAPRVGVIGVFTPPVTG